MSYFESYFSEVSEVSLRIDTGNVTKLLEELIALRDREGRLFLLGVGGSAANCSHAVNDFRKLCGIEAYSPVDNISELTARTNDDGWNTVFSNWLKVSRLSANDAIMVFSVGGGDAERNISANIIHAVDLAKQRGAKVLGIVGREAGYTAQNGDAVVVIPNITPNRLTPLSEAFQAVLWHSLVSHPMMQQNATKW